jgi:hypothetical protein
VLTAKEFADRAELAEALDAAAELVSDSESYTTSSWKAVLDAVNGTDGVVGAQAVFDDLLATEEQVEAATTAVWEALGKLDLRGDPADLAVAVDVASVLVSKLGGYTQESADRLVGALEIARGVLAGRADRVQSELNVATAALLDAVGKLEVEPVPGVPVERAALQAAISAASGKRESGYKSGWAVFQSALSDARVFDGDTDATQVQVDRAAAALTAALNALVPVDPPVLRSVLDAAVAAGVAKSDPSVYTEASWAALRSALDAAGKVAANAAQDQVDAAAAAVARALAGLQSRPVPPKTVTVTVGKEQSVTKVKLAQSQLTLVRKKSFTLPVGVYFSDGLHPSYKDAVVWKSSNPRVVKVNQNGKVTAVKAGTATVTVTTKAVDAKGKKVSASVKVKVVAKKPKSKVVKVSAAKVPKSMKLGQVSYITGKYSSAKATGVKVSYSTSKYHRVVVDKAGQLVAKSKGKDTLTVKAGGKTKKYTITVR